MTAEAKLAGGVLVGAMWSYAATVLYPAQMWKRAGSAVTAPLLGEEPRSMPCPGLGPRFSFEHPDPVFLSRSAQHDHLVEEFDAISEVYSAYVRPFSEPIFAEGLQLMKRYLVADARVLDAACGPGRELQTVARLVPDGEVVGIDLAAGMVRSAHRAARAQALENCVFFQADVGELPDFFCEQFDMVYSCLAHHHYPDPQAATAAVFRSLRPGGVYCVIDPGPAWFNVLSAPLAKWADPGWISFHTPEQFRELFRSAGFARTGWLELLPGFGAALGQKATAQPRDGL
jgi:ubiquinone/menaquinone biosynthesis C-methylase UbiE